MVPAGKEFRLSAVQPTLRRRHLRLGDPIFFGFCALFGAVILAVVIAILISLISGSWEALKNLGLSFFTGSDWAPLEGRMGAWPMLYGTLVSSLIGMVIAVPVSLGIAIFLVEWAPHWLREPIGFLVELLAAIPSIIFGMWGMLVLAPLLQQHTEPWLADHLGFLPIFSGPVLAGTGLLTAGLILALMVIPIVTSIARDAMRAVPVSQREAALALGATRWESVRLAILPYARSGIFGGIILGLGRALGETMAVALVIGTTPQVKASLFQPAYTMSSVIANEFSEATTDLYRSALMEIGLGLFVVTLLVNVVARVLLRSVNHRAPAGTTT
ncbi:MAG: phosphate ABC transporter permease subunit PstC [Firmicutes bacterium]|nr:phosphate ABC transporter permease subunit PstC [Bacillota bacterium]